MAAAVVTTDATLTVRSVLCFFFFNDTATTEIYTLSLHDALPIYPAQPIPQTAHLPWARPMPCTPVDTRQKTEGTHRCRLPADRKSTRLNSSHANISYAVFCLKKKNKNPLMWGLHLQTAAVAESIQ